MEIKKVNLVSREDLESLVKTLDINIYALQEGAVNGAIESLTKLKKNIEANLKEGVKDEI